MQLDEFINQLLVHMGVESAQTRIEKDETNVTIHIDASEDESGMLIGRRGETLDRIQHIVRVIFQHDNDLPITLNINGFREQRAEYLTRLAESLAEKVVRTGEDYELRLPASERRLIHVALQGSEEVETFSEGEGEDRVLKIRRKSVIGV